jgi:hypothetical protein
MDRANITEFLRVAHDGELPRVQKMLADGDRLITDADASGQTALMYAAQGGSLALPTLKWLLEEGGARITERDRRGYTALLLTALSGNFTACQWLVEHGGANITDAAETGQTVWTMLAIRLFSSRIRPGDAAVDEITALMRVMVVRGAPPADLVAQLRYKDHAKVVAEGARLRTAITPYLVRRRALLDDHCPLIGPLLALVRDYDPEPTTTDELWATGRLLAI